MASDRKRDREDDGEQLYERPKYSRANEETGYGEGRGGGRGRSRGRGAGGGRGRGRSRPRGENTGYGRHGDSNPVKLEPQTGAVVLKIMVVVKREHAGAVIGRGGDNVTTIRQESGASIHVHNSDKTAEELMVELTGTIEQVIPAQKAVLTTVRDNDATWAEEVGNDPKTRFHILPEMVGCIIGKQGSHIKKINSESGGTCRVENARPGEVYQQVLIYGPVTETIRCFHMVMDALRSFRPERSKALQSSQRERPPDRHEPASDRYAAPNAPHAEAGAMYDPGAYSAQAVADGSFIAPAAVDPSTHPPAPAGVATGVVPQQMEFLLPNGQQITSSQVPVVLIQNADGSYTHAQVVMQPSGTATATATATQQSAPQHAMYMAPGSISTGTDYSTAQQVHAQPTSTFPVQYMQPTGAPSAAPLVQAAAAPVAQAPAAPIASSSALSVPHPAPAAAAAAAPLPVMYAAVMGQQPAAMVPVGPGLGPVPMTTTMQYAMPMQQPQPVPQPQQQLQPPL